MKYAIAAAAIATTVAALPGNEWEPVKPTTTTWAPITTPKPVDPWVPVKTTCTYTTTYVTTIYPAKGDEWATAKCVTSTKYLTTDVCTWKEWPVPTPKPDTWAPVPTPVKPAETWAPVVPVKVDECKPVYSTYVTTIYPAKGDEWATAKVVTSTKTIIPATCTWAPVPVTPVAPASTWAPAPVAPASTWAATPVAASSTWANVPVAKYTGAASQQTFGMGALAIAAVAALL